MHQLNKPKLVCLKIMKVRRCASHTLMVRSHSKQCHQLVQIGLSIRTPSTFPIDQPRNSRCISCGATAASNNNISNLHPIHGEFFFFSKRVVVEKTFTKMDDLNHIYQNGYFSF
ncbi:hypothetical protein HanRHA438_Chr11g0515181 [Helianthus annuus]|nr:hypothetical protein HanRHA438_Chr11g0515181 [Helianthus annuus]